MRVRFLRNGHGDRYHGIPSHLDPRPAAASLFRVFATGTVSFRLRVVYVPAGEHYVCHRPARRVHPRRHRKLHHIVPLSHARDGDVRHTVVLRDLLLPAEAEGSPEGGEEGGGGRARHDTDDTGNKGVALSLWSKRGGFLYGKNPSPN